jgi:hypothetical protein
VRLYTVLHSVRDPIARVLLIGPFASERNFSYLPWVRWARFLAARGIESLRYDYRGVGESGGIFESVGFGDWLQDVGFLAGWLQGRSPDVPLILHGLELGALLAYRTFGTGVGDMLLLWAPPSDANEVLRAALLRHVAANNAFKEISERKPISDHLQQLEAGQPLEVEGYRWSTTLWRDSFDLKSPPKTGEELTEPERPIRIVNLDKSAAPLVKGASLAYVVLNPDLSRLFADNLEWITTHLGTPSRHPQ